MSWNYRVVESDGQYAVHEVFYYEDGRVKGMSATPVFPRGETLEDLKDDVARYIKALSLEALKDID